MIRIAILLIIGGILSILSVLTRTTVKKPSKGRRPQGHHHHGVNKEEAGPGNLATLNWLNFIHGIICLVDCVWVIVASIFVYRIWTRVELDDDKSQFYCARTLYLFAFSYLTACWVLCALAVLYLVLATLIQKCICYCSSV